MLQVRERTARRRNSSSNKELISGGVNLPQSASQQPRRLRSNSSRQLPSGSLELGSIETLATAPFSSSASTSSSTSKRRTGRSASVVNDDGSQSEGARKRRSTRSRSASSLAKGEGEEEGQASTFVQDQEQQLVEEQQLRPEQASEAVAATKEDEREQKEQGEEKDVAQKPRYRTSVNSASGKRTRGAEKGEEDNDEAQEKKEKDGDEDADKRPTIKRQRRPSTKQSSTGKPRRSSSASSGVGTLSRQGSMASSVADADSKYSSSELEDLMQDVEESEGLESLVFTALDLLSDLKQNLVEENFDPEERNAVAALYSLAAWTPEPPKPLVKSSMSPRKVGSLPKTKFGRNTFQGRWRTGGKMTVSTLKPSGRVNPNASGSGGTAASGGTGTGTGGSSSCSKRKRYASTLYRFSRKELAVALFAHISNTRNNLLDDAEVLHTLMKSICDAEGWDMGPVGKQVTIDFALISKETLIRLCERLSVRLSLGRRPNFLSDPNLSATTAKSPCSNGPATSCSRSARSSGLGSLEAESEKGDDDAGSEPESMYCVCGDEFTHEMMVECAGGPNPRCNGWVHPECVGLDIKAMNESDLQGYLCPLCEHEAEGRFIDLIGQNEPNKETSACSFCGEAKEDDPLLGDMVGPFLDQHKQPHWCHALCAAASDGVGLTEDGLWFNVSLAVERANTQKCRVCKHIGASVRSQRKGAVTPNYAHLKCIFQQGKNKTVRFVQRQLEKLPATGEMTTSQSQEELDEALDRRTDKQIHLVMRMKETLVYNPTVPGSRSMRRTFGKEFEEFFDDEDFDDESALDSQEPQD